MLHFDYNFERNEQIGLKWQNYSWEAEEFSELTENCWRNMLSGEEFTDKRDEAEEFDDFWRITESCCFITGRENRTYFEYDRWGLSVI